MKTAFVGLDYIVDIVHPSGKLVKKGGHPLDGGTIDRVNGIISLSGEKNWLRILVKVGFMPGYVNLPNGNASNLVLLAVSDWRASSEAGMEQQKVSSSTSGVRKMAAMAWAAIHFPDHTPSGRPIARGPVVTTIRESLAAVESGEAVVIVGARVELYYSNPRIRFIEIGVAPVGTALVRRRADRRRVILDLEECARDVAAGLVDAAEH